MLLALLIAANLPGVSARSPVRAPPMSLSVAPEERVCPVEVAPWKDASNAWFFATGPTARLDDQELAAGTLASLIDLRMVRGVLQLFVVGSPMHTGLQFSTAGWKQRWPFC